MTDPELDDEVAGQVLRLDLAALFLPQPDQGGFIVAHDDPGVRAADEIAAVYFLGTDFSCNSRHGNLP